MDNVDKNLLKYLSEIETSGFFTFQYIDEEGITKQGIHKLSPIIKNFLINGQPFTINVCGKDYKNILWDPKSKSIWSYRGKKTNKKFLHHPKRRKGGSGGKVKEDYSKQPHAWILYHHNGPNK